MKIGLIHGFPGFSNILGLTYFHGVEDHLHSRFRDLEIFAPQLAPPLGLDGVQHRAGNLAQALHDRFGEGEKIHLIGHSGGGIDARYLVSPGGLGWGSRIASVTTVGSPHKGAVVAEFLASGSEEVAHLIPAVRHLADAISGFTRASMDEFNRRIVPDTSVRYSSYAGTPGFDITHPVFSALALLIAREEGENDGWISVQSASAMPVFQRKIQANHLEQVGLELLSGFDHKAFYEEIVASLGAVRR